MKSVAQADNKAPASSAKAVRDIRRANLQQLVVSFGTQTAAAHELGLQKTYLNQILKGDSTASGRHMGSQIARRIEQQLGLKPFSMDQCGGLQGQLGLQQAGQAAGSAAAAPAAATMPLSGLDPLQVATLNVIREAMLRGTYNSRDCLQTLQTWVAGEMPKF